MASPMFDELAAAARSAGYQMAIADVVDVLAAREDLTLEQRLEISIVLASLDLRDRRSTLRLERAIEAQERAA